jgi:hypothetical protein
MAQERNLGTARALDEASDEETTKAELQRQMDEARENISQTVNEIKDTVTTQYEHVRETVSQALDWREQFRRRPVAFSVGALSLGFVAGYGIGGVFKGDGGGGGYLAEDESLDAYGEEEARGILSTGSSSYAAQGLAGGITRSTRSGKAYESQGDYRPSYSSGYMPSVQEESEEDQPGLFERFKETQAYDRLQSEVSNLGNRIIEQLSVAGTAVILPALFSKIKDLTGLDLSGQQDRTGESRSRQVGNTGTSQGSRVAGTGQSTYGTGSSAGVSGGYGRSESPSPTGSGGSYGTSSPGGSAYGTSPNQGYDESARDREEYKTGSGTARGREEDNPSDYSGSRH